MDDQLQDQVQVNELPVSDSTTKTVMRDHQ